MYINTRLPARPKQILHYPNPPEARNLKKRQARVRPKPENLRLAHHYPRDVLPKHCNKTHDYAATSSTTGSIVAT